ncbi:Tigger transposable element-derived protein 6 [Dictyocoela muelleri]|nr:Tigger transposable element-derived protein 6 [Dictyocoela muelleri]
MIGVNPFGKKLLPLIVGKSKNTRDLNNLNLSLFNILYRSTNNAWQTMNLFDEYLNLLNAKLAETNRRILLLLDNFPGHKAGVKSQLIIIFPQHNFCSPTLDAGIIHSCKAKSKSYMRKFQTHSVLVEDLNHVRSLK